MKENEVKENKKKYVIAIVLSLIMVITITSVSYAYFVGSVSGDEKETAITTGNMAIEFTDGPEVSLENAIPGSSVEKTFSVKNTGDIATSYDIYLSDLINNFVDKTDLVYTLTSENGANIEETQVPDTSSKIVSNQLIDVNTTQNYTLKIKFKETEDNQDDNKGKQFSSVIRINEVRDGESSESSMSIVSKIASIVGGSDATSTDVIDKGSNGDGTTNTLAYDGTADNNLRYVGANPANYVYYNCSTTNKEEMNDTTCEKWRIIGSFNYMYTSASDYTNKTNPQTLIKIIRSDSLGIYSWDTSSGSYNSSDGTCTGTNCGYGINQWGASGSYEGADLMNELNKDYLGTTWAGSTWYNGRSDQKEESAPSTTLNTNAQNMIEQVVWNTGSPNNNNGTYVSYDSEDLKAPYVYTHERASTNDKICSSENHCNDTVTRTSTWYGKVGLIYPSDYLYATVGGSTTNRQTCLNTKQYGWYGSGVSDCWDNDWIFTGSTQWTLSPRVSSSSAYYMFTVHNGGYVGSSSAYYTYAVRPVVYLKSTISITGGAGTSTNPYTLG